MGAAAADRCAFVRLHCRPEAMLDYLRLYYCHVAPHGALLGAAFMVSRPIRWRWLSGWL